MAEKILESLEIKTGANTSDKYKLPYNVLADPPDLSVYAKLAGNNTFTGGQTITGSNNGYSINASGYIKGSWLQSSTMQNKGSNTGKVCVFDDNGWIYYRTPAEILAEAGGAKLSGSNTFNGQQIFKNTNSGAVAECVMNNSAYDSFTVRNVSDNTKKSAISAGYVWCQDNDNIYSSFKPTGIYYGNDTTGYEGTLKFPTGISGEKTLATTDQIPDVSGKANLNDGNTFYGSQEIQIDSTTAGTEKFIVYDAADGLELINATADSGLALPDGFKTSGFIDCQQGASVGDYNEFLSLNYSDINRPVLTISDGAVLNLDGDTGQAGQVCTSSGDGTAPTWTTPAIKSATLTGTTLYLTL